MLSLIFGGLGEFVAPRPSVRSELQYLFKAGKYSEVLSIIQDKSSNINVNELLDCGVAPIHLASASGSLEITIELISQGVDVCKVARETENHPLHFAALNNHKGIVEILLRSGADPSVPNAHGMIPAELTSEPMIRQLLLRTNWLGQRYEPHDPASPRSVHHSPQNSTSTNQPTPYSETPDSDCVDDSQNSFNVPRSPTGKKNISITIPEEQSANILHMPVASAKLVQQLSARKEKPSRRYSLPPGHPAISLVDSSEKQGYRVREKGKSPTSGSAASAASDTPESGSEGGDSRRSSHSSGGGRKPSFASGSTVGASHDLPIPYVSPLGVSSMHNPIDGSEDETGVTAPRTSQAPPSPLQLGLKKHLLARLDGSSDATYSPLNMPSSKRFVVPSPLSSPIGEETREDSADVSTASSSPRQGASLADIWHMSEGCVSPPHSISRTRSGSMESELPPPPTDPPSSFDISRNDGSNRYAQYPTNDQEYHIPSTSSAAISQPSGEYLLPPPSTSPSFPLPLHTTRASPKVTANKSMTSFAGSHGETSQVGVAYHDMALNAADNSTVYMSSPTDKSNAAARIMPLCDRSVSLDSHASAAVPLREDRAVQAGCRDNQDSKEAAAQICSTMISTLERDYNLESRVMQAARETAESYRMANMMGTKIRELFKACQQKSNQTLVERMKADILAEPELANWRACELGNMAVDGWTLLHAAARWGNLPAVEMLLSVETLTNGEAKTDVWACDMQGRVALHLAAEYSFDTVCERLLVAMEQVQALAMSSIGGGVKLLSPSPQQESAVHRFSCTAPEDLTGSTPLGWAKRKANGRPPESIEKLLFRPGDNSVMPKSAFLTRSGRTPHKKKRDSALDLRKRAMTTEPKSAAFWKTQESLHEHTDNQGLVYASGDALGWRPTMEDRIVMRCPLAKTSYNSPSSHQTSDRKSWSLFGVMDGHGGDFSSDFVSKCLPGIVAEQLRELEKTSLVHQQLVVSHEDRIACFDESLKTALCNACLQLDALLSEQERMKVSGRHGVKGKEAPPSTEILIRDVSGTTVCFCVIGHDVIAVANVGDSRAIMGRYEDGGDMNSERVVVAEVLSEDHKFEIKEEQERAARAGFSVTALGQSMGEYGTTSIKYEISHSLHKQKLRLSRSVGDFHMKWSISERDGGDVLATRGSYSSPVIQTSVSGGEVAPVCLELFPPHLQPVSCMPDVTLRRRDESRDLFIVVACDGIWDVMSNTEVVQFVDDKLSIWKDNKSTHRHKLVAGNIQEFAAKVCDDLLLECLRRGSEDNMSLLLVLLPAALNDGGEEKDLEEGEDSSVSTPRQVSNSVGDDIPAYDTPECIASPSPLYLPGTLEEEDDEEGEDCSLFGGDVTAGQTIHFAPSPIKATKLF